MKANVGSPSFFFFFFFFFFSDVALSFLSVPRFGKLKEDKMIGLMGNLQVPLHRTVGVDQG